MGHFWAAVVWMADRRKCSRRKSLYRIATKRDGCIVALFSKPKRKFWIMCSLDGLSVSDMSLSGRRDLRAAEMR